VSLFFHADLVLSKAVCCWTRAQLLEQLKRAAFNPVMTEFSIFSHRPNRGARKWNWLLICRSTWHAVVLPGNTSSWGSATPILLLEGLNRLELKVIDFRHKGRGPFLELYLRNDIDNAAGNNEIVDGRADVGAGMKRNLLEPETFDRLGFDVLDVVDAGWLSALADQHNAPFHVDRRKPGVLVDHHDDRRIDYRKNVDLHHGEGESTRTTISSAMTTTESGRRRANSTIYMGLPSLGHVAKWFSGTRESPSTRTARDALRPLRTQSRR
jgi:hypothetical protein